MNVTTKPDFERDSLCFDEALSAAGKIVEWNAPLMDELMVGRRCNCQEVALVNGVLNLYCGIPSADHNWLVQAIFIIMFALIITMAIGGNLAVIWIVLAHKQMRTVTNYFLLNLAIADFSISLFNVCFNFVYILFYKWWFGEIYCYFSNFMGVAPTCASVFTLMSMSIDRYVAIMNPLRRRLSGRTIIMAIIVIWMAAMLCALPMALYSYTQSFFSETGEERTVCYSDNFPDGDTKTSYLLKIYNYFLLFIIYVLPLGVLSFTFIGMARILWGSNNIGEHRHEIQNRAKRKIVKMLTVVGTLFMICWLPYHVYFTFLMPMFAEMDFVVAQRVYLVMYWLAMSSTVVNPIVYCWMNSRYAFRWLPCVHISKNDYYTSELNDRGRFKQQGQSLLTSNGSGISWGSKGLHKKPTSSQNQSVSNDQMGKI